MNINNLNIFNIKIVVLLLILFFSVNINAQKNDSLIKLIDSLKIELSKGNTTSNFSITKIDTLTVGYFPIKNNDNNIDSKIDNTLNYSDILIVLAALISAIFTLYGIFWQGHLKQKKEFIELLSEYLEYSENEENINREILKLQENRLESIDSKDNAKKQEIEVELKKQFEIKLKNSANKSNEYMIFTQLKSDNKIDLKLKSKLAEFPKFSHNKEINDRLVEEIGKLVDDKFKIFKFF